MFSQSDDDREQQHPDGQDGAAEAASARGTTATTSSGEAQAPNETALPLVSVDHGITDGELSPQAMSGEPSGVAFGAGES